MLYPICNVGDENTHAADQKSIWSFPRVVRDLARNLKKEINLELVVKNRFG